MSPFSFFVLPSFLLQKYPPHNHCTWQLQRDGREIHQGEHIKVLGLPDLDLDPWLDLGEHKINLDERVKPSILSVPELNVEQQQWVEDLKRRE